MANILLQFCRETNGFSNSKVAGHLGISEAEYLDIEKGNTLLSQQQSIQLGKLFKTKPLYFFKEAIQGELLHSQANVIMGLRWKITRLKQKHSIRKN